MGAVIDGKVKCISTGTVVCVSIVVQICAGFDVTLSVPSVALAGLMGICIICAVVDSKV